MQREGGGGEVETVAGGLHGSGQLAAHARETGDQCVGEGALRELRVRGRTQTYHEHTHAADEGTMLQRVHADHRRGLR